ncbi:hypothetical protein Saa2_08594 [Streptomyces acidiscabies]|nr:hypothetical protein Saa2_08594 [Streptomyces acidiscabies]
MDKMWFGHSWLGWERAALVGSPAQEGGPGAGAGRKKARLLEDVRKQEPCPGPESGLLRDRPGEPVSVLSLGSRAVPGTVLGAGCFLGGPTERDTLPAGAEPAQRDALLGGGGPAERTS